MRPQSLQTASRIVEDSSSEAGGTVASRLRKRYLQHLKFCLIY